MARHKQNPTRAAGTRNPPSAPPDARAGESAHGNDGHPAWLSILGASHHNLKNIDVHIPLGRFVCVTGVSGSGKSSLVNDIIREQLARDLNGATTSEPGAHRALLGKERLDKVIDIDQSPIGRTPRSNPATYIKLFDEIRDLYARLPDSKVRGYKPGRFSFNVPAAGEVAVVRAARMSGRGEAAADRDDGENGSATAPHRKGAGSAGAGGRCEVCEGNGATRVEMDFLADVWVTCAVCEGRRFNRETLAVRFRGKNIAEVLDMDVQQALEHFANVPQIADKLKTLHDVGLDYLKLGQASTTLSGGEAQRIKLARELVRKSTGRTLYLLDEPTTGLHFEDVRRLLSVLHGFVDSGNSVIVIEHHLDVIKTADWIIDLGPEGGAGGGYVIGQGTPEDLARVPESHTARALVPVLRNRAGAAKPVRRAARAKLPEPVSAIRVVGAREHNLQDVSVEIPRNAITVCSGVSGSGKSSFAIDTVYTEGHRRYVESLSAYARQFLGQLQKPKVDHVYGLSPAIAIEQKSASKSPRSTVGTVTEIYDYMRVLWARVGTPYCPKCDQPIGTQSADEIVEKIAALPAGQRVLLCAPIERLGAETYEDMCGRHRAAGYVRVRVDGVVHELAGTVPLDNRRRHSVQLVIDRVVIRANERGRLTDSVEQCLGIGGGVMLAVLSADGEVSAGPRKEREVRYSQHYSCDRCNTAYEELTPNHFSFNARLGWCPACEGLGVQRGTRTDTIVRHPERSLLDGAIAGWEKPDQRPMLLAFLKALTRHIGCDLQTSWCDLAEDQQHKLLFGTGDAWIPVNGETSDPARAAGAAGMRFQFKGFFPAIDEATRVSWQYRFKLDSLVTEVPCEACRGGRLRRDAAAVRLASRTITQIAAAPLDQAYRFFTSLSLDRRQKRIAGELLREITSRLRFLLDVGLEYLTLSRGAPTLSGGEAQRIRLASQIGSGLTGVLYVLDEPTIGLHPRDNRRLIAALTKLRDLGNTLLMVEHDRDVIEASDHVLDFGPGAGRAGGRLMGNASPARLRRNADSLTGRYLHGTEGIPVPTNRRTGATKPQKPRRGRATESDEQPAAPGHLTLIGARQNNLQGIDVTFPLNRFICVTGVSGSGKSSLISDILYPALAQRIHRAGMTIGSHDELRGVDQLDKVINVDQMPIGNSPLSNPATYTAAFDLVRELFAKLPDSKVRGYTANRFSSNRPGGRCEACEGLGQVCHEMHFLPDVWVTCDTCAGHRYNPETLDVRYKGKNIADVLEMSVAEALALFDNIPRIKRVLRTLADVGLDYMPLGQSAPTLSGGEAQRVKLAAELGRPNTGRTIYILDEPTTGLHIHDVRKLLDVLHRFVDLGNTVVCIEHNLDVIKTADWVIDLGPEPGEAGGRIVAEGTPEQIAMSKESHTGRALKPVLERGPAEAWPRFDPTSAKPAKIERAKKARLELDDIGGAKMPWERDGRRWHTTQRPSRDGGKVEWDGELLEYIVERVESLGGDALAPTHWNDRACVEIRTGRPGVSSKVSWFMHILTGGRWLLEVSVRVPTGVFESRKLAAQLGLKTLDQRTDLPIYGNEQRVVLRPIAGDWDNIRILVHDKPEVTTPAFQNFLATAVKAYVEQVSRLSSDTRAGEPWRTDGRSWHLGQKLVPPTRPAQWSPTMLVELLGRMSRAVPSLKPDWARRTHIGLMANEREIGRVATNSYQGLHVQVFAPPGRISAAQINELGEEPVLRRGVEGKPDTLDFWVRRPEHVRSSLLADVMKACLDAT